MPYHDVKILDVKDIEIKGHFDIIMMHCCVVHDPHPFKIDRGATLRDFFVEARSLTPK
jgi:hypothetical protein